MTEQETIISREKLYSDYIKNKEKAERFSQMLKEGRYKHNIEEIWT